MNREEVKAILDKAGRYNVNIYGLQGYNQYGLQRSLADDQYVIDLEGNKWVVYFYEKGRKHDQQAFNTEDEACSYLIHWILPDLKLK
jgi:hypothetical protein